MAAADPSDLYWMQQPGVPEHRTHEQRILAMQADSYKVLCDIREHLMCIEHLLRHQTAKAAVAEVAAKPKVRK